MAPFASKLVLGTVLIITFTIFILMVANQSPTTKKWTDMADLSFQQFTGISLGGISGASGQRFQGNQCRSYQGKRSADWSKLDRVYYELAGDAGSTSDKWVVITSINPPTEVMEYFDKDDEMKLVVVFDKKTPTAEYEKLQRAVLLTVEKQEEFIEKLGLESLKTIPWNHFGRKNVGYIYAIAHGAQVIYDTDDDNVPFRKIDINEGSKGLSSNLQAFNVYSSFKPAEIPQVWPRGFPLDLINPKEDEVLKCCTHQPTEVKVGVKQYLANKDPDVDAIYRLTAKLPFDFRQDINLGYALTPGTMIPYNAQATLHYLDAFFGLLLPITVHGRVSDIWRSYYIQKMLWLTGQRMAYMKPLVIQDRNVHNYLSDFDSEIPLYIKSGELVKYITEWTTDKTDIRDIMVDLAIDLFEHCYWEYDDVSLIIGWLKDLTRIGYTFPKLAAESLDTCAETPC